MISEESDPLQGFLNERIAGTVALFLRAIKRDFRLHLVFLALLLIEGVVMLALLSLDPISWSVALTGAAFLFTLFSYLSLRVYFTSEKRGRFDEIERGFIQQLRQAFDGDGTTLEERRFISQALLAASKELEGEEFKLFFSRWSLKSRVFASFFWHDLFVIRESLLKKGIEEEIERVKLSPLDPDQHVALANHFVLLGDLYKKEKRGGTSFQKRLNKKFLAASERALLEFKILRQYDPKDPWILFQLAYTLGDLGRKEEELSTYEEAARLRPHDLDALQKLGTLYFQSGRALEGLEIFDQLRRVDRERAEELIVHYR